MKQFDLEEIKRAAREELEQEQYRKAVVLYKTKLKSVKWWHRLVPFKVVIIRREKWN